MLGSLGPVSPLPRTGILVLGFLAVFAVVLAAGVSVREVRSFPVMSTLQFAAVGSILAAGVVLLAASLGRQMIPGSRHRVPPAWLLLSVAVVFWVALALLFPWQPHSGSYWVWATKCYSVGASFAALAAVPLWLLVRRGAILWPALTGATTGLLGGLMGATVIYLGCWNPTAPHLAVSHAAVPISSGLLGLFLGTLGAHWRRHEP